jgi:hypothetical protein
MRHSPDSRELEELNSDIQTQGQSTFILKHLPHVIIPRSPTVENRHTI